MDKHIVPIVIESSDDDDTPSIDFRSLNRVNSRDVNNNNENTNTVNTKTENTNTVNTKTENTNTVNTNTVNTNTVNTNTVNNESTKIDTNPDHSDVLIKHEDSDQEVIDEDSWSPTKILNVLINQPEKFQRHDKPKSIQKNAVFVLDSREIEIDSAKADDNGAYVSTGNPKKHYYWENNIITGSKKAKFVEYDKTDNCYYLKVKSPEDLSSTKRRVPRVDVYELKRSYRKNKNNPTLTHIITQVRNVFNQKYHTFYLVTYKNTATTNDDVFVMPKHGNAKHSEAPLYYRHDPSINKEIDVGIEKGHSTAKIYRKLAKTEANSLSKTIKNPKVIDNRRAVSTAKQVQAEGPTSKTVGEAIVSYIKKPGSYSKQFFLTNKEYGALNYSDYQLLDLKRHCVDEKAVFSVDTTFDICENLFLTDSTYENLALIDAKSKNHPQFPGPSFWHFRKNNESYRRFAGELIIADPDLLEINKIGHDLDKAIHKGFKDIFRTSDSLWCTKHLQDNDAEELRKRCKSRGGKERIMADIYGSQQDIIFKEGLADAVDANDLSARIENLRPTWENLAPGFTDWFRKNRVGKFNECLVIEAREAHGITKRYTTNALENQHRIEKKELKEDQIPKHMADVSEKLGECVQSYYTEARRAIRGIGKYRLAPDYQYLAVEPATWCSWNDEKRDAYFEKFMRARPLAYAFEIPENAGKKPKSKKKKRRSQKEPEIFITQETAPVKKLKLQKNPEGVDGAWQCTENEPEMDLSFLDPSSQTVTEYTLVLRSDHKLCPKTVKRCQQCRKDFSSKDLLVIKSFGDRGEYQNTNGQFVQTEGNIYMHFKTKCLTAHDANFKFESVVVPERSLERIPEEWKPTLINSGIKL